MILKDIIAPIGAHENSYVHGYINGYSDCETELSWISVKDRLPDTTDFVFTCIEMNGRPQCVGFHYYKDGKWFEGFEEDTVGAVDYWMPIPELPKEEKQ